MARPHQHQVEYVGSPPPPYSPRFHQPPAALHPSMPPLSPPRYNGGPAPMPGPAYPQPPLQIPHHIISGATPQQQQEQYHNPRLVRTPLPPSNFAAGNYHPISSISGLPPPSVSLITLTQSPPLHPFPPPTPLANIDPIHTRIPPRLSHSPGFPLQSFSGFHSEDAANYVQHYHPAQAPPNIHHHGQHNILPDLAAVHPAGLRVQQTSPPQFLPPPGYHHQHGLLSPPAPLPPPPPPPHQGPHPHGRVALPIGWMRSPPSQQQQFLQLASGLNQVPVMHQHLSPSAEAQRQMCVQFLPPSPARQVSSRNEVAIVNEQSNVSQPTSTLQVSEQVTSTSVQRVQSPPLQPVSVSKVIRPTPVYSSLEFQSPSSESPYTMALPGPSSYFTGQLHTPPATGHDLAWRSQAMPPSTLKTTSILTTPPQAVEGNETDTILEQTQLPMSSQEAKELDEYSEFAAIFRSHRLKLGYTHADVIQQVGIRYGYSFSTDTIYQFEARQLPFTSARNLKPVLQMWLKDTVKAAGSSEEEMNEIIVHASTSINPKRERKRRTNVDSLVKGQLEEEFRRKRTPSQSEMLAMANRFGMEKEFVRVWFCNRRQRQKKLERELKTKASKHTASIPSPKATIPSPSHDITVEVPSIDPRDAGSLIHEGYLLHRTN